MRFYRYTKARYALETLRTGHPKVATLQNPNAPFELLSLTVKTKEERNRPRKLILFSSRLHALPHLSTRQYTRLVHRWIASISLDDTAYGTHTMRRKGVSLIYRRTKNLRAVQLLPGHARLESTGRYLGVEVDDALEMAEQAEARPNGRRAVVCRPQAVIGPSKANGRFPSGCGRSWRQLSRYANRPV